VLGIERRRPFDDLDRQVHVVTVPERHDTCRTVRTR
jgi:hypothetical protein